MLIHRPRSREFYLKIFGPTCRALFILANSKEMDWNTSDITSLKSFLSYHYLEGWRGAGNSWGRGVETFQLNLMVLKFGVRCWRIGGAIGDEARGKVVEVNQGWPQKLEEDIWDWQLNPCSPTPELWPQPLLCDITQQVQSAFILLDRRELLYISHSLSSCTYLTHRPTPVLLLSL